MGSDQEAKACLIPVGGCFEGLVVFRGEGCIAGELRGAIEAQGRLRVGPFSRVEGPVSVDELVLAGDVEGDVVARQSAKLEQGATLRGTLRSPRVAVADGARIQGACRIGSVAGEVPNSPSSA
ncbi:MAG: polymer-forming cytoskeletal protein [Myxococcota bacterium]